MSKASTPVIERWVGIADVHRDNYRKFCALAGVLNPGFGIVYLLTNPDAIDPLWARFALGGLSLLLLSFSYMSAWVKQHFERLVQVYLYSAITFYVGLTALNGFSPDYTMGMMFVITAVGIIFSLGLTQTKPLTSYLIYSVLLVTPAIYFATSPQVSPWIVSICAISISVVIYVAAHSKISAEKAMHASEMRYRTLMNAANDAIFIVDAETAMILDGNDRAQQLSGRTLGELREMKLSALYPPDRREEYASLFDRHVFERDSVTTDLHLQGRDGRLTPVDVSASLVETGGQQLIQGIFRDATERHHYEQKLIEAKEHAEEMLRLKTSFLNNMSHEIRTPLTSILGFSDVLVEEVADEQRECVSIIYSSAERLHRTLNSVLDLAQLESGKGTIGLQPLNLHTEIQEAVSILRPLADQKKLHLRFVAKVPNVYAALDPGCLNRIVNNLVGNAIKFTEEGYVNVEVDADDDTAYIRVRDTGIGIHEEFLAHIFDEFRQESSGLSRSYEGNGLGLSITKRLVELLNGTIKVDSIKELGSTFTVSLPRVHPEQAGTSSDASGPSRPAAARLEDRPIFAVEAPRESSPRTSSARARILAVEDNPATRSLLTHWLSAQYDVVLAGRPEEAIEIARKARFDLLLFDINLTSALTGVDLLREVRTDPAHADTPAIALTVYALQTDKEHFLRSGFDYYLSKPLTRQDLMEVVEQAICDAETVPLSASAQSY